MWRYYSAHLTGQVPVPAPSVPLCAVRWLWRSDFPVTPTMLALQFRRTGLPPPGIGVGKAYDGVTAASQKWRGISSEWALTGRFALLSERVGSERRMNGMTA